MQPYEFETFEVFLEKIKRVAKENLSPFNPHKIDISEIPQTELPESGVIRPIWVYPEGIWMAWEFVKGQWKVFNWVTGGFTALAIGISLFTNRTPLSEVEAAKYVRSECQRVYSEKILSPESLKHKQPYVVFKDQHNADGGITFAPSYDSHPLSSGHTLIPYDMVADSEATAADLVPLVPSSTTTTPWPSGTGPTGPAYVSGASINQSTFAATPSVHHNVSAASIGQSSVNVGTRTSSVTSATSTTQPLAGAYGPSSQYGQTFVGAEGGRGPTGPTSLPPGSSMFATTGPTGPSGPGLPPPPASTGTA